MLRGAQINAELIQERFVAGTPSQLGKHVMDVQVAKTML
jgi:hypothetical protein